MEFEITDGLGLISIGMYEMGSYFSFENPVSVEWYDCMGSVARYFVQLPVSVEYRLELNNRLQLALNNDYSKNEEALFSILSPIFKLFKNGRYNLKYHSHDSNTYFKNADRQNMSAYCHFEILFASVTNVDEAAQKKEAYALYTRKMDSYNYDLLEYTTTSYYDGENRVFLATQSKQEINQQRVSYFEEEIKKGNRPFILTLSGKYPIREMGEDGFYSDESIFSETYVLDGHHKLLAYYKLNIYPSVVEIIFQPGTRKDIPLDLTKLMDALYPWQVQHLLDTWEEKEPYIADLLQNPNSKIHNFIHKKDLEG